MAQDTELVIKLLLEDKDALTKLNNALGKMDRDVKSKTESMGSAFATMALEVAAAALSFEVFRRFIDGSIKAATEQEDAINRLNQAMKSQGTFTESLSKSYQDLSVEFQSSSRFADEAVQGVIQKLITLGNVAPSQMERATKATLDLATALKIDLESAATLVGKASEGNTAALSRYGIKIDESIPKNQRFVATLQEIEKRMGGAAQADIHTFSGAVTQMSNAWNDAQESIGNFIIHNPQVIAAIQGTTHWLQDLKNWLDGLPADIQAVETAWNSWTSKLSEFGGQVSQVKSTWGELVAGFAGLGQNVVAQGGSFLQKLFGGPEDKQAILDNAQQTADELANQKLQNEANEAALQQAKKATEFNDLITSEQTKIESMRQMWDAYRNEEQAKKLMQLQQDEEKYNFFLETRKKADQSYWVAAGKLRDTFSAGVSKMFQDAIDGNFKFGEAFKQLGIQMIKVLVDFAAQKAVNFALSKALEAAHLAASIPMAAALANAWAVPAALVSAATFGASAAAGGTALAGAVGLAKTLANIPGLQEGGTVTGGGTVLVGEAGPELLSLPRGAQVTPLNQAGRGGGGGDTTIHIEINHPVMTGNEIAEEFAMMIATKVSAIVDDERRRL